MSIGLKDSILPIWGQIKKWEGKKGTIFWQNLHNPNKHDSAKWQPKTLIFSRAGGQCVPLHSALMVENWSMQVRAVTWFPSLQSNFLRIGTRPVIFFPRKSQLWGHGLQSQNNHHQTQKVVSEAQFEAALLLLPHAGCYSCRYVLQSYSHELVVEKEEDTWKFSPLTRMKPRKQLVIYH